VRRRVTTALLVAVVALPGLRLLVQGDDAPDGFPLSTYPMFTHDRGRTVEVPSVVVVDGDDVHRLSPEVIADTDQVIEANVVVQQAIAGGSGTAAELCRDVAARTDDAGEVQVVVERYDSHRWAAGDDDPIERRVVASCR
jgi:hypothetical protein